MPIMLMACGMTGVGLNRAQGAWDNDLWWHLRLGSDFLQQGNIRPPHWSPFENQPWVPTEPVTEVVAAVAERWAGLDGVMWLYACSCVVVVLVVYVGNRAVGRPHAAMFATLVATLGCSISLTPRPQLVSFVLLALVFRAWNRTVEDLQPRWYLIPLVYGWSLCHGFWFIGAAYGFVEVAGLLFDRRVRIRQAASLLLVSTLSAASVLLSPVGLGVFTAPFAVNEVRQYGSEWEHTTPTLLAPLVVLLAQVAVVVLWCFLRQIWSWRRLFLLLTSVFWLWYAWRTVAIASIATAPLLAEAVEAMLRRAPSGEPQSEYRVPDRVEARFLTGWLAATCLTLVAAVPVLYNPPPIDSPIDESLDRLAPGAVVFNQFDIGGYLTWRHPALHPVIDGLITPYSVTYVHDYFESRSGTAGWHRFFSASGARAALLLKGTRLTRILQRRGWIATARFNDYVLLEAPKASP
jgi:hypothetical protein